MSPLHSTVALDASALRASPAAAAPDGRGGLRAAGLATAAATGDENSGPNA